MHQKFTNLNEMTCFFAQHSNIIHPMFKVEQIDYDNKTLTCKN